MKREELKKYLVICVYDIPEEVRDEAVEGCEDFSAFDAMEAAKVMDTMEARIKELESIPHTDNSAVISTLLNRIKELEAEVKKWKNDAANCCALLHLVRKGKNPTSTDMITEADRLEKLEDENARLKSIVDDEEYKQGISGLAQRNAELREENDRLKAANFDLQSHFDVLKEDYDAVVSKLEKVASTTEESSDVADKFKEEK